jgi:ATP-dependent DNA helicase RecQ
MNQYVHSTGCLRTYILRYFGDKTATECNNCSGCVPVAMPEIAKETPRIHIKSGNRLETISKGFAVDKTLYEKLKALRRQIADEQNVPAFVVFSDTTLVDMCKKMPGNRAELLGVVGVGEVKADRYGEAFLELIKGTERLQATPPAGNLSFAEISDIIREQYTPVSEEITISQIADMVNAILTENNVGRITATALNQQLIADDYLDVDEDKKKIPSEKGSDIGIRSENAVNKSGVPYLRILFNQNAQAKILNSLLDTISITEAKRRKTY